jgi:hypothetical protein
VHRKCSGIALSETGAKHIEEEPCIGWVGGVLWLVPTEGREIKDWKPVAKRNVEWKKAKEGDSVDASLSAPQHTKGDEGEKK